MEDLSGLPAGTYSTTVFDANGCETSVEFTISEPDELAASVLVTNVSCNGLNDGSAEITVVGGTAPYETEDLSSLSAGDYSTTVIDANGCETSVSFTVSEPDELSASVSVTDALCNGGSGSAALTIEGGTAPYNTEDLSSLSAGDYTTTITDANGCETSVEFTVSEQSLIKKSLSLPRA